MSVNDNNTQYHVPHSIRVATSDVAVSKTVHIEIRLAIRHHYSSYGDLHSMSKSGVLSVRVRMAIGRRMQHSQILLYACARIAERVEHSLKCRIRARLALATSAI